MCIENASYSAFKMRIAFEFLSFDKFSSHNKILWPNSKYIKVIWFDGIRMLEEKRFDLIFFFR